MPEPEEQQVGPAQPHRLTDLYEYMDEDWSDRMQRPLDKLLEERAQSKESDG